MASATFIDSLALLKPFICLRNSYVQHYFDFLGDVGHLCDSYEELRDVVCGILDKFPRERYQRQIVNILNGRSVFSPENLALKLRSIVEACEAGLGRAGVAPESDTPAAADWVM